MASTEAHAADPGAGRSRRGRSRGHWSRILFGIAVGGPALAVGGVHPEVVPAFAAVVLALWLRICARSARPLRVPWVALLFAFLVGATALQWVPIPGLRGVVAPDLQAMIDYALAGTGVDAWPGLSACPDDTLLEVSRLVALAVLVVASAQLSWRVAAFMVAVTGTVVALVGLAQDVFGLHAIYGVYEPEQIDRAGLPALMGTFVNANHQSGLLLLGLFCAIALAVDQRIAGSSSRDTSKVRTHRDRSLAALAALAIQLPALVLSLSRAALISFAVVAPIAAVLALWRSRSERKAEAHRTHPGALRLLVGGALVVLVAIVARHGAWQEVSKVWAGDIREDAKITMIEHAPGLVGLSPVLGTGRGTFIDLYPSIEPAPSYVLSTHLESAPLAVVVEWGPIIGGIALLAALAWLGAALWYGGKESDARPRRIVLLGLLALAVQNLADFAFEFVGVAAPACALVGGLSPARFIPWTVSRARIVGGASLVAAIAIGILAAPGTWSHRDEREHAFASGRVDEATLLRERPLDGTLHAAIARARLEEGDAEAAYARAEVATELRPGSMHAWLIRSAAAFALGDRDDADASMRRALAEIHVPPGDALLDWIVARYPEPDGLAALAPTEGFAWKLLVRGLEPRAPAHADAVARVRAEVAPDDPEPLLVRSRIALATGHVALALHHARLARQLAPQIGGTHLAVAAALEAFGDRDEEIVELLEEALADGRLDDPAERGAIEEQLVRTLLSRGDAESLDRAQQLAKDLLGRPATRDVRRRRIELAKRVEAKVDR